MGVPSDDELARRRKVYDQMCTMHSLLRDRSARNAQALDILLVVSAALMNGLTFFDPAVFAGLGVSTEEARFYLGIAAICAFAAALVAWRVDWKAAADRHDHAAVKCADLKAQAQALRSTVRPVDEAERERFFRSADLIMGTLAKIPDADFLPLKARHVRKVAISKLLEDTPGASVAWIRVLLVARDSWRVISKLGKQETENG